MRITNNYQQSFGVKNPVKRGFKTPPIGSKTSPIAAGAPSVVTKPGTSDSLTLACYNKLETLTISKQ